jgi:2-oxoisovalerate dehydrogenase E1 component
MNPTATTATTKTLLELYRTIFTIRRFEERVADLRARDEVAGSVHLCLGQESIAAAALAALDPDDLVISTYRGHGWALAAGVDPEALMAEICQRAGGVNGGRGGSPYLSDPEHRFIGENSIVGAGLPVADGLGLAAQLQESGRVIVVAFGDGATSQGAAHEALVMAVARSLPVIFICENNRWSEMTPIASVLGERSISDRAEGYGLAVATVDGTDLEAVAGAVAEAARRGRAGDGPTFIECHIGRLAGHYNADVQHYRDDADKEDARRRDPVAKVRAQLLAETAEADVVALEAEVESGLDAICERVLASPKPDPATAADEVAAPGRPSRVVGRVDPPAGPDQLTYAKAITEALERELEARPEAILFGEDVAIPGGVFGVTRGLRDRFGAERVFDTPIAEAAILGSAVGAALAGLRPMVEIMWADFLLVALDQLINQAANVRYLSQGRQTAPILVRCQQGVTPGSCAQHSQSLEALLAHIPGLRVGMASNPADAYAMTRAAVAHPDPVVLIESRAIYGRRGPVDLGAPVEGVGGARLHRGGDDLAIISWGRMVDAALAAADTLAADGIQASVLDLRWLSPLDDDAIAEAVVRCHRVLICHEANVTGGFGAEVAARIAADHLYELDAPVRRVGSPDVRYPSAPVLQEALLPGGDEIVAAAREMLAQ